MLVNKVNQKNYQNYFDRLAAIHEYSAIPDKFKQNKIDPFKPFYICPIEMGIRQIYDEAAAVLKNFTINEIKEIRSFLSQDILEIVNDYAVAYGDYLEEPSYSIKNIRKMYLLMDCYFENNNKVKTYQTSTGKEITIKELYAVLSLKYLKKAASLIRKSFDGALFRLISLVNKSPKMFVHDFLNTPENKIAFKVRNIYQKIGELTCTAIFILIEGDKLKNTTIQEQLKKKRLTGLLIARKDNEIKKQYALKIAQQTWEQDTEQVIRTGYMAEIVYQVMLAKYAKQTPVFNTIKNWIKDIRPNYADKKGRESKQNKELLFELYKITVK